MNTSTKTAQLVVERCLAFGAKHVVIAPGSRSAPLSWAFAQAEKAGVIKVHVRIDERDAGFLALGLAKASRTPVPVVVTSGSAVANLFPAVVEAYESAIPVVVLSADRPSAARGTRAPQTINQSGLFGTFVNANLDIEVGNSNASEIDQALGVATDTRQGPVQINVQFDLPLMPDKTDLAWAPIVDRTAKSNSISTRAEIELPATGLVIVGDTCDSVAITQVDELSRNLGWPIIWEPTGNAHSLTNSLSHGVLLVQANKLPIPEAVVTIGAVGLSRAVLNLLKQTPVHIAIHTLSDGPETPNPVRSAAKVLDYVPTAQAKPNAAWLTLWQNADLVAHQIVESELSRQTLSGLSAAVEVWQHAGEQENLFVAASWAVRHLEAYAGNRNGLQVFGNRGANGIDGLISTAYGIASEESKRTYLLIGDVAFMHDLGGLNIPEAESQPPLTIVVLDNDGSGIFSQLEQGASDYQEHYEKVFGTPHGKDLWVIAEALGIPAKRVTTKTELAFALKNSANFPGLNVIVCTTGSRMAEFEIIKSIATKVEGAL